MYLVYDDSGKFKIAKCLTENDSSLQIETLGSKRAKIKKNQIVFRFSETPDSSLTEKAQEQAQTLDVPFLWESAPQGEFALEDFANEYYGAGATVLDKLSLLYALHEAPIYFHRKGRGLYKPAPPDILEAALNAQEKKRKREEQIAAWTEQLCAFEVPEDIRAELTGFLISPDKNSMGWKAFEGALERTGLNTEAMLLRLGIYKDELKLFWAQFLGAHFPKGTAQPPQALDSIPELPKSEAVPYSIDNLSTTEIDDALGARHIEGPVYEISVHIAVPALLIKPGSEADKAARKHMSTVYVPGTKIPMQADNIIEAFSLDEGQAKPALSLYTKVNLETGEILESDTRVDQIVVKKNLRLEELEGQVTEEALNNADAELPYAEFFRPLWQMAQHLGARREEIRGKPEENNRFDFNFSLDGAPDDPDARVTISRRKRGAPLDRIVAEYMILANSTWAGQLSDWGLTGVFRSQNSGRVRQSTYPDIHKNIGVSQYAWMTSPLRRYVDLLNQQQMLCGLEHGVSARLVTPYDSRSVDLLGTMAQFETVYNHWRNFQDKMERYWSLRWLQQQELSVVSAEVIREDLAKLEDAPLVVSPPDMPELPRGSKVEFELSNIDLLALRTDAHYVRTLETPEEPSA